MPLGLYVSRCGGRVDSVIDIEAAAAQARAGADVFRIFDDLFDPSAMEQMLADVDEFGLDAVVLAGNSVEHYARSLSGGHLKERFVAAGVNPNRVIAANILEQVALAHPDDPEGATLKAGAMMEVARMRASLAPPLESTEAPPKQSVLVLGANAEGIVAAQRLLQIGFSVVVADRGSAKDRIGAIDSMRATVAFVLGHPKAEFVDGVSIADGHGWAGDFEITLDTDSGQRTYSVGGLLLADTSELAWVDELRGRFKVDVDDEGRVRSIDPRAHPSETVDPGIMIVPPHDEGEDTRDRLAAVDSAVLSMVLRLSHPTTVHYRDASDVDETLCGGCSACVRTCAFGACYIDEDGLSHVDIRRCTGCGKCVVSCPVGARDIVSSPHDYLIEAVRALSRVKTEDAKVLGFLCGGCGYPAGDDAANAIAEGTTAYPASFLPVRIPCGGRLDTLYVLEAFKAGFDGVTVFRCREGHCHNLIGNLDMDRRMNLLRTVLRSRGIDDSVLRIIDISPFDGARFAESVNEVYETARSVPMTKGGPQ